MFGHTPWFPVDILFRFVLSDSTVNCYDRYVASLSEDLKEAMDIAQTRAKKRNIVTPCSTIGM